MITIKQLQYFSAVAKLRHFGRAAEFCNVTQPALSMQVQALEKALGLDLLERGQQGAALTPVGHQILKRAETVLSSVRDREEDARQLAQPLSGRLSLGVIPSVAPYLLPRLLPGLQRRFPNLELRIRETQTERLVEELLGGRLDLLLLALPIEQNGLATRELFIDRFFLAAPRNWVDVRLARGGRGRNKGRWAKTEWLVDDSPLLLLEEGHCLRDQALEVCDLRQLDAVDTFGASSLSTLVQMVVNGLGLTLLPEMSLEVETRHRGLTVMPFEPPEPSRTIGLAWRQSSPRGQDYEVLAGAVGELALQAKS